MKTLQDQILAIRRAGVPLVAVETNDPSSTVEAFKAALKLDSQTQPQMRWEDSPAILWDIVNGARPLNKAGANAMTSVNIGVSPDAALIAIAKIEANAIVFMANANRYLDDNIVVQALWNLRDELKCKAATLVMLGSSFRLPAELVNDVLVIAEPLPNQGEVKSVIQNTLKDAGVKVDEENLDKMSRIMLGISAFAVEQSVALSIENKQVNHSVLWERKRKMVEATDGLSVWRGSQSTFANLGGLNNIKDYMERILTSKTNPVNCIGFIDEIEKLFPGVNDQSGVSQDQLKVMLTEMQDNDITGLILIGPPGTGKTELGKAAASVADAEFINIDTGAMMDSLVGQSQHKIRAAFKTFNAVSQKHGMFIVTCNKIASLPPELRRRFSLGTFFVDLPSAEERATIWKIWTARYFGKAKSPALLPKDEGWTGAEIKACCDVAYRMGCGLLDAARYIMPVSKSAADQIEALRQQANGRYISASYDGTYQYSNTAMQPQPRKVI